MKRAANEGLLADGGGRVSDVVYEEARRAFSDDELVALTMADVTINTWKRLKIALRTVAGAYPPHGQVHKRLRAAGAPKRIASAHVHTASTPKSHLPRIVRHIGDELSALATSRANRDRSVGGESGPPLTGLNCTVEGVNGTLVL